MADRCPSIAIVGATGVVGLEALSILESRRYAAEQIQCYGSERSAGSTVPYMGTQLPVSLLDEFTGSLPEFALLCADAKTARRVREMLDSTRTTIIDNSSAFRMDPDVPLVIPEVNGYLLRSKPSLVANPNCSTIMMLTALQPIREAYGIQNICVTTYQAVSGAGKAGIQELRDQTRAHLDGLDETPTVFPCSCAMNVFEHESEIDPETGFNGEETKMILESRRIWDDQSLSVLPTCIRVPVERAHSQSIIVEVGAPVTVDQIRQTLRSVGIRVLNHGVALTPRDASGHDEVFVGRIRIDPLSNGTRVVLWVCCDQIRKGAALNAIQIMDLCLEMHHQ
tara:strand:+ start:185458 stop:186471 length:1014 start_codon:yes stop_codon:yes gene_type:complete